MAITAQARDMRPAEVVVCFRGAGNVPNPVLHRATFILTGIFERAGIRLVRDACPLTPVSSGGPWLIEARFAATPPIPVSPGALAYAQPFGDETYAITLLYDRITGVVCTGASSEPAILAHVLAHEIGHVLQAIDRHSRTGVMKAHWKGPDFADMSAKSWDFTPEDMDLMRRGIDSRAGRGLVLK